jgi:hypothetical protein
MTELIYSFLTGEGKPATTPQKEPGFLWGVLAVGHLRRVLRRNPSP